MRILHVLPDTGRRTPQVFAHDLARAMGALGHDVPLVHIARADHQPAADEDLAGDVLDAGSERARVRSLRERMRSADVTVAHGPAAGDRCAKASRKDTPFVYRQVRDTRFWVRRPGRPNEQPAYFRKARAVVAMSPGARADLIDTVGLAPFKAHAIPIGADSGRFRPPTPGERAGARERLGMGDDVFVAMTVGTIEAGKGIDLAIRAAIEIVGVRLVVVGSGSEAGRMERLAEGLAPGRVAFTGRVGDVEGMYAAADVVVHPSVMGDSMSPTLIEAGLMGLPVVATRIGSSDHVIHHEVSGLLLPPGDVAILRQAMERLRNEDLARKMMGDAARERCLERFSTDVVAKEWIDLLASLVIAE
jgi:glycosyltransferase involved in cell wall biosynthesis